MKVAIGGEASVDVAIGGETSVTVDNKPLSDAVSAPCNHAAVRGNAAVSASRPYIMIRLLDEPIYKSFKKD